MIRGNYTFTKNYRQVGTTLPLYDSSGRTNYEFTERGPAMEKKAAPD
jgi:hypothetical protein